MLKAKAGERFIGCGPSVDETMLVTIEAVEADGTGTVTLSDELAATKGALQLVPLLVAKLAGACARRPLSSRRWSQRSIVVTARAVHPVYHTGHGAELHRSLRSLRTHRGRA